MDTKIFVQWFEAVESSSSSDYRYYPITFNTIFNFTLGYKVNSHSSDATWFQSSFTNTRCIIGVSDDYGGTGIIHTTVIGI